MNASFLVNLRRTIQNKDSQLCEVIYKGAKDEFSKINKEQKSLFANMDILANGLMPEKYVQKYIPIKTTGDGNCFYNSVSLTLCGKYIVKYR